MNILIDGRVWSRNAAGITTFLTCALTEWAKQRPGDTFHVLMPKGKDPSVETGPLTPNIHLHDYSEKLPRRLPNIFALQALVPRLCRKWDIDLYYTPVPHLPRLLPSKVKTLVTVHDVVNIEMRETMAWTNRLATSVFFGPAVRRADYLWANSYYTKGKIDQYFPRRKCHEVLVGDAADRHLYHPETYSEEQKARVRSKHGIQGRFLLFVGSLEPRKNLEFLLQLMPQLYQHHHIQLVVVGGKGWKNSALKDIVCQEGYPREAVIFCGYVTNDELADLYHSADCFVSAAKMEGFGMPQLEALLCGCPIITAHNTAMVEVAAGKDGATTVKGYKPDDWERAIVKTLEQRPRVKQEQLAEYDWEDIMSRLITFIQNT